MKSVGKIKIIILCSVTFFFFENHAVYEKMEKNYKKLYTVLQETLHSTLLRGCFYLLFML